MRTTHAYARLRIAPALLCRLAEAATRVAERLRATDPVAIGLSPYATRYLRDHLAILPFSMQSTVSVLGWALEGRDIPKDGGCLVDYGGGIGLISLVAVAAGIPVAYADHHEGSACDAQALATSLDLQAQQYLVGDLPCILDRLRVLAVRPLAFVSYDVLEHIYDVPGHIAAFAVTDLAPPRIVYASSANARNPRIRSKLTGQHRRAETVGVDGCPGYLGQRRDLIAAALPDVPVAEREILALGTRGLARNDLAAALEAYRRGQGPATPRHPTNTCDPRNGNWCEQLLDHHDLIRRFAAAGYTGAIRPGYYGESGGVATRLAKHALNLLISLSGSRGVVFAPYYAVVAQRTSSA